MSESRPLILTAKFDEDTQIMLNGLRERYFPSERNMIPAHLSLFNQLPGDMAASISSDLDEVCGEFGVMPARIDGLRFLGKGVAYTLDAPKLATFRKELAHRWEAFLGSQDRQKLSPHVTVQNKVSPESAKELYGRLDSAFAPTECTIEGASLWRYLGGPWEPVEDFLFSESGD